MTHFGDRKLKKKERETLERLVDVIERLESRLASIEDRLGSGMQMSNRPLRSEVETPFEILESVGTPHISKEADMPISVLSTLSSSRKETLRRVAVIEEKGLLPTAKGISALTKRKRNQESGNLKRLWQLGLLERIKKGREIFYKLTDSGRKSLASVIDS